MAVDLKQFHQVFIEESYEGLDIMEKALMELNAANIDSELINAIFRAAHSIKGGGATFGFTVLASFTHVLETLLDEVRSNKRGLTPDHINLLLQSVDCMRDMLGLLQQEKNQSTETSDALKAQFEAVLQNASSITQGVDDAPPVAIAEKPQHWWIEFTPKPHLLLTGNCPLRLLTELEKLGPIQVKVQHQLPKLLNLLNPETCYLSWHIQLESNCPAASIQEIFEWVEDDAQLSITPISHLHQPWRVQFKPQPQLLRTGNDPIKLFSALAEVACITHIQCQPTALPSVKLLDPENLYLAWDIHLLCSESQEALMAIFDWVADDAEIIFTQLSRELTAQNPIITTVENPQAPTQNAPIAVASEPLKAQKTPEANKKSAANEASSIRVGIDKIDSLINLVGELVITQSMLGQLSNELDSTRAPKLMEGLSQLAQNTRELQESVMRIRMLPISFTFSRFPRMVRDLSQQLGKKIHLELQGETTELDKTVMEKIGDPLVHLVRNAIDHGIEFPQDRLNKGKPEEGLIILNAYHQSGNVIIEIIDDGKGLDKDRILEKALEKSLVTPIEAQNLSDEQIYDLIFQPGFSTAQTVSDVSGRGVGMDVVKRNIQALNGVVEVHSTAGKGSRILIRLPLTLAILDGQLVRVGNNIYIFPLVSIIESMQYKVDYIRHIAGGCSVFKLREDFVPIVHLKDIFNIRTLRPEDEQPLMVVVEAEGEKVGVVVDELLAQQQVVIKSLEQNYRKVEGISGATILGDGTVSLILDVAGLVKIAGVKQIQGQGAPLAMLHASASVHSALH